VSFFYGGYLEAEVFKYRSRTLEELKTTIREGMDGIPHDTLAGVMENYRERLHVTRQGHHLNDKIFGK